MPLVCPICRDVLEGSSVETEESGLVAGECGHVFHKKCLSRWIEEGTSTNPNRCPCCRRNFSTSKFVALFPTTCNNISSVDSSDDFITLRSKIDELNDTIKSLKANLATKDGEVEKLSSKVEDLATKNKKLTAANKVWMKMSDKKNYYKKGVVDLKAKVQSLVASLNSYKSVTKVLNNELSYSDVTGTANDCCKLVNQNVIEENKILSSEVQNLKKKYEKLKDGHDKLQSTIADMHIQQFSGLSNAHN